MSSYLNNAAEGWPKAPGVAQAVTDALTTPVGDIDRDAGSASGLIRACRMQAAELLGITDCNRIVFTANATYALNLSILGMKLGNGSLVAVSAAAHNSVLRPLERLRRETGIRVRVVACDATGAVLEEDYSSILRLEPRLVILNHRCNVTGHVEDVPRLFAQAHFAGALTLLDASQSVGHLDCKASELHADMIAFNGNKGLHGPTGVGALYVAPGLELHQTVVGGTGARSDLAEHPPEMPMRLEAGTPNLAGLAGFRAALAWHSQNSADHRSLESIRAAALRRGLKQIPGVFLAGGGNESGGIVSMQLAGWPAAELGHCLQQSFGLTCRSGLHCAPLIHKAIGTAPEGTVRFSISGFTTEEEVGEALDAVSRVSRCTSLK
ncbi:aminotransferase class V-fold PLP-dependent enzyme [Paludibaculum fermentans]|uniref:Aminotransferase class V-fold PLP-dependent enzyme n=1 Tax=Paludibaculum fermentans TaxID=1473598 RepID=A0A7S7SKH8_PALFE|nr:aminotransferase class V-fold PLP-dependent enzyme [Paludibaculum fermentans]QOY87055.1 aminotransferase class V-fold PLP-dependent enzyme [Paludibaculum fermentans]